MTDTYQPTEAPAPPAPPPPQQDAPAQSSPFDAALTGLERSIANEQRIQQQKESALAPKYAALQSSLSAPIPQPPQPQRMPQAPKPPGPEQALFGFATAMLLLGALSSKYTRMSSGAALSSFNGALQGWQAGNLQAYEEKSKEWEANTKATIQNNKQETEQYKQIMENRKLNIDQQMDQIKVTAAQYQDKMMFEAANAKNYTLVAQIWEKKNEAGAKLQLQSQKLLDDREKQKQKNEQTAQYWLSPEGQQRLALPEGQPGALTEQQKAGVGQLIQVYGSKGGIGGGTLTPETMQEMVDRRLAGDKSVLQNIGRGAQGSANVAAFNNALATTMKERGITGPDLAKIDQQYVGDTAYQRGAGGTAQRVENAVNEVAAVMPLALEASRNLPRGNIVPLNNLIQKYEQGTSDPKYNDFIVKNFALINAYTRAMNPLGVPRIQERLEQHAIGLLSTATSQKAYETQVRALWQEAQASKGAVMKTREGRTPGDINAPLPELPKKPGADDGWKVERID